MKHLVLFVLLLTIVFVQEGVFGLEKNSSPAGVSNQSKVSVPFAKPVDIANGSVNGVSSLDARDIDGDGLIDVAVIEGGKHAGGKAFAWFKAPASSQGTWKRYEFNESAPLKSFLGSAKLVDVDNDNDNDLVVSSDNHSGGTKDADIFVFENPLPDGDVYGKWNYVFVAKGLPYHHINDMEVADMDNDGKIDIVVRSLEPNQIHIFFQNGMSSWTKKSIPTHLSKSEGLGVGKMNSDAFPDITFTGFLLRAPNRPRSQKYIRVPIDSKYHTVNQNTKEAIGDIDGDNLPDIVISPAEAYRAGKNHDLAWYKNPGGDLTGTWKKSVVLASTNNIHTVKLAFMDNDDKLDIVAGVAWGNMSIKIYLNGGNGIFTSHQTVSKERGLYSGVVVDIGKDGDMDIIGQGTYAKNSRPYLYESLIND